MNNQNNIIFWKQGPLLRCLLETGGFDTTEVRRLLNHQLALKLSEIR